MADNGRSWLRLRWRTMFLLALVGIVGWSVYSYWSEYNERAVRKARELMAPAVGALCEIELADDQSLSGMFVQLNDEWIVLSQGVGGAKSETWIPRDSVQLMRVQR